MKKSTIETFVNRLTEVRNLGISKEEYCKQNDLSTQYFYGVMHRLKSEFKDNLDEIKEICELYSSLKEYGGVYVTKETNPNVGSIYTAFIGNDDPEQGSDFDIEKQEEHDETVERIVGDLLTKESRSLNKLVSQIIGHDGLVEVYHVDEPKSDQYYELSREEVEILYKSYPKSGANLSAEQTTSLLEGVDVAEVKYLLKAFGITKDSVCFAPHIADELTVDELALYRIEVKQEAIRRNLGAATERQYNSTIKKLTTENRSLMNFRSGMDEIIRKYTPEVTLNWERVPFNIEESEDTLILFLADMHIGAKVENNSMYHNPYDKDVVYSRIDEVVRHLICLGQRFNNIIIADLGDRLDGMNQQTTRGGHILPQNMNNYEQVDTYVGAISYLFSELVRSSLANEYFFYAVNCGNHDGVTGYAAAQIAAGVLQNQFGIETYVSDQFWMVVDIEDHTYVLSHGKDEKYMKGGLKLNLDDKIENWINQYLDSIPTNKRVNIVSGDLHNEAMNRGKRFKYFKAGSFFGSSDYCMYGFGNTPAHINYHIIKENNTQLCGTIEL